MADQKAKEMEPVETQTVEIIPPDIENLIYMVRNKQVMVDSDLAMLYQVETGALNRAVKRNIARFPEDFRLQLTKDDFKRWWNRALSLYQTMRNQSKRRYLTR